MRYDSDKYSWEVIGILLLIMAVIWFAEKVWSADKYNNGVCEACGGQYVYQQAVGHRYSTEYIYICDKCGHMIKIDNFYPDAVVKEK